MTTFLQFAENLAGLLAALGCLILAGGVGSGVFLAMTHGPWARYADFNE